MSRSLHANHPALAGPADPHASARATALADSGVYRQLSKRDAQGVRSWWERLERGDDALVLDRLVVPLGARQVPGSTTIGPLVVRGEAPVRLGTESVRLAPRSLD